VCHLLWIKVEPPTSFVGGNEEKPKKPSASLQEEKTPLRGNGATIFVGIIEAYF